LRTDPARLNLTMPAERLDEFVEEQIARYTVDESEPFPFFGRITGSSVGGVWLPADMVRGARPMEYAVVSADGGSSELGTFGRPVSGLSVNESFVLGLYENELGLQVFVLYRYDFRGSIR